jgi:hypothetical protein
VQLVKINSGQDVGNIGGSYVEFGKQFNFSAHNTRVYA